MKKTIIIIAVVIVIGIGVYYIFFSSGSSQTPTNTSQTNTPPVSNNASTNIPTPAAPVSNAPTTPAPANVTVSIKNFFFSPSTLTVKKGAKVIWVNNDSVAHTVTSDSGNLLNSGTLSSGQSFSFTFMNTGSVSYHCNIHPMMKGNVNVEN